MHTNYVCCSLIAALLLSVTYSWSFEKEAHREMSKRAVQIYNELYPVKSGLDKELAARFVEGSVKEDDISFQRLTNWHFYDPGERLGLAWWGASKANTKRFANLANELAKSGANDLPNTYELAGRLGHHIQDMSSPPHTVPVYHTTKDPFDKYSTASIAGVRLTSERLDAVKREQRELKIDYLRKLLKGAAERTIGRVESPATLEGKVIADNWTGFWRKYELVGPECGESPKNGFGCYGKNSFGDEKGYFTKELYFSFYKEQIASAVEDSLRLLFLFENMRTTQGTFNAQIH